MQCLQVSMDSQVSPTRESQRGFLYMLHFIAWYDDIIDLGELAFSENEFHFELSPGQLPRKLEKDG